MNKILKNKSYIQAGCILLVVIMHAFNKELFFLPNSKVPAFEMGSFIQIFLSHGVGRLATPTLFFIAGLIFFTNFSGNYFSKLKRRIVTLLVPFLIWNYYCFFILKAFQGKWIGTFYFPFYYNYVENAPLWTPLRHLVSFPLWFMKDLMLLILISPVIYFLLRKIPWVLLVSAFFSSIYFNYFHFFSSAESLLYFSIGGMFVINSNSRLFTLRIPKLRTVVVIWLFFILAKTSLHFIGPDLRWPQYLITRAVEISGIFIFVSAPWEKLAGSAIWKYVTEGRFFLHAGHVPLIDFINFNHQGYSMLAYCLSPLILTFFFVGFDQLLRKLPRLHNILSGSR